MWLVGGRSTARVGAAVRKRFMLTVKLERGLTVCRVYVDFILSAHNSAVHNLCHDTTDTQTKMYFFFLRLGQRKNRIIITF